MSEEQPKESVEVVRAGSCASLSKGSTISFEIGTLGDKQYIRLSGNRLSSNSTGGGLFCRDWILLSDIQQLLQGCTEITSKTLKPLYAGKSANSPGFLLACVLHEKLVPDPPPQKKPRKTTPDKGA